MVVKNCVICGKEFDTKGRALTCSKECSEEKNREQSRQYYQNNKEKIKEYQRQYNQDNKEKLKERQRQYYQDHKEKIRERQRQYRQNNKEYFKQYYQDNKENFKQYYQNYKEKKIEHQKKKYEQVYKKLSKKYDTPVKDLKKYLPPFLVQRELECFDQGSYFLDLFIPARERANGRCEITGKKTKNLVVHHLNGYNWCVEGRMDLNNVVVICEELHDAFHQKHGYGNNTEEQFWKFVKEWEKGLVTLDNFMED